MKFSYDWLKDFIDLPETPETLAEHCHRIGFEVEALVKTGPQFSGVVVGSVLKAEKHPNADRLPVCEVSDGTQTYPVVCGAPNVAAGQRVAFARVGAELAGGMKLKKSKIRGAVSEGMICSESELGLAQGESAGILVLPPDTPLGTDFAARAGKCDAVLDLDVKPNRPDCLSHLGLARELAVSFGLPLKDPWGALAAPTGPEAYPVSVADAAECPRYMGCLIEGIKVGPSPQWLVRRLEAVGLRPINNIVDATNYVLFEAGQPLHAFDADLLQGGRIEVRDARPGESILALDGKEYRLTPTNLVIADASRPVAIAGVIGGQPTAVSDKTTRIFLEVAGFRPGRIRRSGGAIGVRTDSSYRFERGIDAGGMPAAAARAAALIVSLAGGRAGAFRDTAPAAPPRKPVTASPEELNRILGTRYPAERIETVLGRLSLCMEKTAQGCVVHPPSYRADLETPSDLAEEVARHLGYDAIPDEASPVSLPVPEVPPLHECRELLCDGLCGLGWCEAYNYDFVSVPELERFLGRPPAPGAQLAVLNPISEDWALLRPTLLVGLLRSAALNFNRGAAGLRLFEAGRAFLPHEGGARERSLLSGILSGLQPARPNWKRRGEAPDLYEVKGTLETLLRGFAVRWQEPSAPDGIFHPGASLELLAGGACAGKAGVLHPELVRRWDLGGAGGRGAGRETAAFELDLEVLLRARCAAARFQPFSAFPSVARDLSLLAPAATPYAALEGAIRELRLDGLQCVELLDLFTGKGIPEGRKSWTVRLTFSRADRTLRDAEVQEAVDRILPALRAACGAELRS